MSVGTIGASSGASLPVGATALVAQKKVKGFGYTYPQAVSAGTYLIKAKQSNTNAPVMLKTSTDTIEIPKEGKLVTFSSTESALRFYNAYEFLGDAASKEANYYQSGSGGAYLQSRPGYEGMVKVNGVYVGAGRYYQDAAYVATSTNFKDWTFGQEMSTSTPYAGMYASKTGAALCMASNNTIYYNNPNEGLSGWTGTSPYGSSAYAAYVNETATRWMIGYTNGTTYSTYSPSQGWNNIGGLANGNPIYRFKKVNGLLFALGGGGYYGVSTDGGDNWSPNRYVGQSVSLLDVGYDGTRYVMFHQTDTYRPFYSTTAADGSWTQGTGVTSPLTGSNPTYYLGSWIPEESRWISIGNQRNLTRTSTNGQSWTIASDAPEWEPTGSGGSITMSASQSFTSFAMNQSYTELLVASQGTPTRNIARRAAGFELEIYSTGVDLV